RAGDDTVAGADDGRLPIPETLVAVHPADVHLTAPLCPSSESAATVIPALVARRKQHPRARPGRRRRVRGASRTPADTASGSACGTHRKAAWGLVRVSPRTESYWHDTTQGSSALLGPPPLPGHVGGGHARHRRHAQALLRPER